MTRARRGKVRIRTTTKTARRARRPSEDAATREARCDLAAALRWADKLGLSEGICNHFSYMIPGQDELYLINPMGLHWREIRASDLLIADGDGNVVAGDYPLEATAFYIHSRVHRGRKSARCVLHTHMPYASTLTVVEGARLEPIIQSSMRFHGNVAYDDEPHMGNQAGFQGTALTNEEGDRLVKALGDKRVLFMMNHGVLVVGENVAQAFDDLYFLERAAQQQVLAMSTGHRLRTVSAATAADIAAIFTRELALFANNHFESLKRLLDREAPGWRD
jgi:ribulose-5-phosphate 4-epimerase/fuculose-1-phosphate aldolase